MLTLPGKLIQRCLLAFWLFCLAVLGGCEIDSSGAVPAISSASPAYDTAFVCNMGFDADPGMTIGRVDLESGKSEEPIRIGQLPSAEAVTPDGRYLLVTDQGSDQLTIFDLASEKVVAHVRTGLEPDAVAVSPNGKIALVADQGDNAVTPVDLGDFQAGKEISVGGRPDAIGIGGTGGDTALVANLTTGNVTVVNLDTLNAGSTIAVGAEPDSIAISPDGQWALVGNMGDDTVTGISIADGGATGTVNVGADPTNIAVGPTGASQNTAWVTGGSELVPVTFESLSVGSAISVGHVAEAAAVSENGAVAWVADLGGLVTPINLSTGTAGRSVSVGGDPDAILIPPKA